MSESMVHLEEAESEHGRSDTAAVDLGNLSKVRPRAYAIRFGFGFAIAVIAAVVGMVAGARIGGLFLAFPAILPATLTLLEKQEGTAEAASDVRGAAIGGLGMLAFALVAAGAVTQAPALALAGALIAWVLVSGLVYLGVRGLIRLLGERQYLPEIPTVEAAPAVAGLRRRGLTIATAESCSGGMVSALLCALPDAREVMRAGVVAYTDDMKRTLLGVPLELLEREGAVSRNVAIAMARGARRTTGADVGVAVTGLTGEAAEGKPAGLTFIAVEMPDGRVEVEQLSHDLGPGRNHERAVRRALQLLQRSLNGNAGSASD